MIFPKPTRTERLEKKKAKRQGRAEQTRRIREERFTLSGGRCETVIWASRDGVLQPLRCSGKAEHIHHLLGGRGRRREQQSVENVRMLCRWCHGEEHR